VNGALQLLITALIAVESHGNDSAHGRSGEVGCLQITQAVIDDVNRAQADFDFTLDDALFRERAVLICEIYLRKWATVERLGYEPTLESMARIWNGGPTGATNPATLPYWAKVKRELQKLGVETP